MEKLWALKSLKVSLILGALLCFTLTTFSQKNIDFVEVDNLGNIYAITATDTLFKVTPDGNIPYNYSNKTLGQIGAVNSQNPLKILVGHPGLSTIVVLDVTLRETARVFLPDVNIFSDSTAFCLSNENNIYIYDDFEQQVVTINEEGVELDRSPSLLQEVGYLPRVRNMAFANNILYLNDPENGILMLDQFGKYIKTLPLKGLNHFQVVGNKVIFLEGETLLSYNTGFFDKRTVFTFPRKPDQAVIGNKVLYSVINGEINRHQNP